MMAKLVEIMRTKYFHKGLVSFLEKRIQDCGEKEIDFADARMTSQVLKKLESLVIPLGLRFIDSENPYRSEILKLLTDQIIVQNESRENEGRLPIGDSMEEIVNIRESLKENGTYTVSSSTKSSRWVELTTIHCIIQRPDVNIVLDEEIEQTVMNFLGSKIFDNPINLTNEFLIYNQELGTVKETILEKDSTRKFNTKYLGEICWKELYQNYKVIPSFIGTRTMIPEQKEWLKSVLKEVKHQADSLRHIILGEVLKCRK
jgi:hypothetical protein